MGEGLPKTLCHADVPEVFALEVAIRMRKLDCHDPSRAQEVNTLTVETGGDIKPLVEASSSFLLRRVQSEIVTIGCTRKAADRPAPIRR